MPPGVLNVVQGIGARGRCRARRRPARAAHQLHRLAGDRRRRSASPRRANLVPFTAELGGKGPLVVFADADLDAAAATAARMYDDAGQVCLAGTRLLVERVGARRVLRALPRRHRRARARRLARRRDDDLPAHPPRPPRARRGLRRARAGRGRRRSSSAGGAGRTTGSGTSRRSSCRRSQRRRDRPARGLRAGAHAPDVRRRGRGDRARELDALRPVGDGLHDRRRARGALRARRSARGRSGRTASWCATSPPRSAGCGDQRHRPGGRRLRARLLQRAQDRPGEGGDDRMGEVVGAAVLSPRARRSCCPTTSDARSTTATSRRCTRGSSTCAARSSTCCAPDLVVVFDSHWFTTVEFVVAAQARRAGRYTSEELPRGMSQVPYDIEGDPEFAERARRGGRSPSRSAGSPRSTTRTCRSTTRRSTSSGFLQGHASAGSRSASPRPADTDDFLTVGECVGARRRSGSTAASSSSARVRSATRSGRCASCAPTRRPARSTSSPRRPPRPTTRCSTAGSAATTRAVIDAMPEYRAFRPEGRFGHYLMTVGGDRRPGVHREGPDRTRPTRTRSAPARSTSSSTGPTAAGPRERGAELPEDRDGPRPRSCRRCRGTTRATCSPSSTAPTPPRSRALLPDELDLPHDDEDPGAVAFIWADWQACSDDGRELDDPIRLQYKEAFVVVRCRWRDELWSRCVFIWVDKDFAMVRGHLQGYPKKLGSVQLSRPVTVGRGGPRLEPGGRFAATARRLRPTARRGRGSRSTDRRRRTGS